LARLGSIVDPAKDLVRGSNHEVFCLNGGLSVQGAEGGHTGICPIDAQLVSLGRPGLWRYTREYAARTPDVFVLLFDNVYSTNFRQWIAGSWSSRVRLWATGESETDHEALIGNSWEARVGCLAAVAETGSGKLPAVATGLVIAKAGTTSEVGNAGAPTTPGRGLLVTAFGRNPYGEGTLLRLWEQAGASGEYTVQLPAGMKARTAQPCNLRGENTGRPRALSAQGTFNLTLKPMAPASVLLLGP
jgi:hypothetical protein